MDKKANDTEKIILTKNTQREMIKFFMRTSMPKLAKIGAVDIAEISEPFDKEQQQTPKIQNEGC